MAKKILIIDDDLYIRDLYKEVLTGEGFEVEVAIDGQEGLDKILAGGYDLILLDVMLPKIDGLGILTRLSIEKPKVANGSIVLLTNLSNDPIITEAQGRGAKAALIKSDMTPEDFVAKVKEFVA